MGALKRAYTISLTYDDPDPDFDLEGHSEAKWGHHTWRRTSDKMAQATAKITGATTLMIDELYGWRQMQYS